MGEKRAINAKEFVADVRSGMADSDLMKKYLLTQTGLRSVFGKLIRLQALTEKEIDGRPRADQQSVDKAASRRFPRYRLDFDLPVFDQDRPLTIGTVRDITEKGVGVHGISAKEGERKILVVGPALRYEIPQFALEAVCRWTRDEESTLGIRAGFEVIALSERSLEGLRKLISRLTSHKEADQESDSR